MSEVEDVDEQGTKATAETLAKIRPDPLYALYTEGKLAPKDPEANARMFDAALEIRMAFEAITSPVSMRGHDYQKEVRRSHWEVGESHAERLWKMDRVKRRYVDWVDAMTARKLPAGPVLDVVVDGMGVRESERNRRRGHGWVGRVLREGLRLYCEQAGWLKRRAA